MELKPVVAYQRISTDSTRQDLERQREPLKTRATTDKLEILAWVEEEERAGEKAMPTFDRPKVKQAMKLAGELRAVGLLVENVDRWTRKGADDLGYSMFVLRRDYGLELIFSDLPADPFAREILPPIMATLARLDNKRRADQQRTSAALRKSRGIKIGRTPRPDLTDEEFEEDVLPTILARRGLAAAAVLVGRRRLLEAGRGGLEVVDPKARRFCTPSESWLADQLAKRPGSHRLLGRVYRPGHGNPPRKAGIPGEPTAEVEQVAA